MAFPGNAFTKSLIKHVTAMGEEEFGSQDGESFRRMRDRLIENAGGPAPEEMAERLKDAQKQQRWIRVKFIFAGIIYFAAKAAVIAIGLELGFRFLFEMFPDVSYTKIQFWKVFVMVAGFMLVWLIWPTRTTGVSIETE